VGTKFAINYNYPAGVFDLKRRRYSEKTKKLRIQKVSSLLLSRSFVVAAVAFLGAFLIFAGPSHPNAKSGTAQPAAKTVDFTRDIRPIFSDICFACHGPDDKQRKAGLRLDKEEGALSVVVPGDSANSTLIQRITSKNPAKIMPPPESGRSLTPNQIELFRRWVDEGAEWKMHWAYVPPKRPEIPKVRDTSWPRKPIDNFILSRLEREGLRPSPMADKETLLRRVTLDLTGLPPTREEIRTFLDDQSVDAYERRVDQLLRSPHYGERMAMQWLDLARYADTHGYHIDPHRDMWPWRDWVIRAFNGNMPFDQFSIEQLAGDLLPSAGTEQRIASGFNRNHMINFEGGAIPEEYQVEYVVDRVETTANTWMGMTMGCARCHNHKYDPITQKEFYQFFAFFNTVPEKGLDGKSGNAEPILQLPTSLQKAEWETLRASIKEKEEQLSDAKLKPVQEEWEKTLRGRAAIEPREGLLACYEMNGSLSDISGNYRHGRTVRGDPTFGAGQVGRAVSFDGDTHVTFGPVGSFDGTDAFSIALWLRGSKDFPVSVFQKIQDAGTRRGYEVWLEDIKLIGVQKYAAHLAVRMTSHWPDNTIQVRTPDLLQLNEWHHIVIAYDGSGKASGLKLYVNGKLHDFNIVHDNLSGSIQTASELQIGNKELGPPFKGSIDDLRIYNRCLTAGEVNHLAVHYPIQVILSGVNGKASKEETARVRDYFLTYAAPEPLCAAYAELKRLQKEKGELERKIVTVMVMKEMEKPRETYILGRGDYRNKTDKVSPGVPAVLTPFPKDAPSNRFGLAKWLLDARNPLTARVTVNRYWQMYFGQGIVKTSEDFGFQGEAPVHPELLDWLATEFIRSGWDVRAMQRLIVTSATYRQSSKVTAELLEKDPENRLLARGPRFRLPAEMIRDGALAASGLLNKEIGGPGVSPYQPKGLWEEMAYGAGYSAQSYKQSTGRDLYRRSLYTFWKRTVPPPNMATFDAPDREKCTARRALTNTPLQALVLMNDPTYVEAARAMAQRVLREAGKNDQKRIDYAFLLATARAPSLEERRVLQKLLQQRRAQYRRNKTAAAELLRIGESSWDEDLDASELAAWTTVASTILNLDETITKE
ncbi:MAG TPA: DUF1553 domain-containing protein, partial [Acidobacteriota bacterium]|nr:DUF1553 domain-containing protein [Acidobacteriota bacterium]